VIRQFKARNPRLWLMDYGIPQWDYWLGFERN